MPEPNPKRLALFKLYSDNLTLLKGNGLLPNITPKYDRTYICPICLTHFSEEEAMNTDADNFLTFEDVPPVSLGGKANILTCKHCNNTCGHTIDVHLSERMKEWDKHQFLPGTEAKVKIEVDKKVVQAEIIVQEGGIIQVKNSYKNNNPVTLDDYIKSISDSENPVVNLKFSPTRVNPDRLQIALLKIGYLMTFKKFGYAFLLDSMYDKIRTQLLSPDEKIYPPHFWSNGDFPLEHGGAPIITEKGLECIAPIFPLITNATRAFITIIPLTAKPIEEVIDTLKKRLDETPHFEVEMTTINDDNLRDIKAIKNFLAWVSKLSDKNTPKN